MLTPLQFWSCHTSSDLVHWANLWSKPQHWCMKGGMRHRR